MTDVLSSHTLQQQSILEYVERLCYACNYEIEHSRHVTFLALRLFDELTDLHQYGSQERFWLECGGLLHDIGWSEGWKGHHKVGMQIIMETPILPYDHRERVIVGSIVRYHRQAMPSIKHNLYATLDEKDRQLVDRLGGILRMADGLDGSHKCHIRDLCCKITPRKIVVLCAANQKVPEEMKDGKQKSDLLQMAFQKKILLKRRTSL